MSLRTRPTSARFDSFDRTFDQLTRSFFAPASRTPVVDARGHDGSLELTVDLPGTPDDAIDVSVAGRTLTIAVETESLRWTRSLSLASALDPEAVTARYEHGRLTISVAPAASATPRRIAVSRPGTETLEQGSAGGPTQDSVESTGTTETTDNT